MRVSILALVATFNAATLAQLAQLPVCAQTRFGNNIGSCSATDIARICGNSTLINSISCCVFATCSQSDIQATINFATSLCKTSGVNINTSSSCAASTSVQATSSRGSSLIASVSLNGVTKSTARSTVVSLPAVLTSGSIRSTTSSSDASSSGMPTGSSVGTAQLHSGLSKGAIAGIVVGVLAALVLLGIAVFLLLRRRKQQTHLHLTSDAQGADNMYTNTKPELAATGVVGMGPRHELEGRDKEQPSSQPHYPEMWAPQNPAIQHTEMPSYAPGGQLHTHIAGGEIEAMPVHSHYVENTGPYFPEAYTAPAPQSNVEALRLAQLEASQREWEQRMARMRQLNDMEAEHARIQAEIARLRGA